MKTNRLTGAALDWAVAKCEGPRVNAYGNEVKEFLQYSRDWAQGGPIIEREKLCIEIESDGVWLSWSSQNYDDEPRYMVSGDTALRAAMRCYVASKLGDEVDVPKELL